MAQKSSGSPVVDPSQISEILCVGRLNVLVRGDMGTITFTHARPKADRLMNDELNVIEHVVRARIVTTREVLESLRRALNDVLDQASRPTSAALTGKPN